MRFYPNKAFTIQTFQLQCNNGKVNLSLSTNELGYNLFRVVREQVYQEDDAGCEWATDDFGDTYIQFPMGPVKVSRDPHIATLIDAANLLISGYRITTSGHAPKPTPEPEAEMLDASDWQKIANTIKPEVVPSCCSPGCESPAVVSPDPDPDCAFADWYCQPHYEEAYPHAVKAEAAPTSERIIKLVANVTEVAEATPVKPPFVAQPMRPRATPEAEHEAPTAEVEAREPEPNDMEDADTSLPQSLTGNRIITVKSTEGYDPDMEEAKQDYSTALSAVQSLAGKAVLDESVETLQFITGWLISILRGADRFSPERAVSRG